VGRSIRAIERLGKRPILCLDSGDRIVFEPRMTGLLLIGDAPDRAHLRLGFALRRSAVRELWFWDRRGLGNVRLIRARDWPSDRQLRRLGPDALRISASAFRQRLVDSRRPIKVALLDQVAVAGIGNLYASEILHVARVHPCQACCRITNSQWSRIHAAMRQVLRAAIRYEGSTLNDGTFRNALNQDGSYQNEHRVYERAGQRCPICRTAKIRRIVQAQRSTFFCPNCQAR
jgi:formamidopyrimidine-DNA glycosylase